MTDEDREAFVESAKQHGYSADYARLPTESRLRSRPVYFHWRTRVRQRLPVLLHEPVSRQRLLLGLQGSVRSSTRGISVIVEQPRVDQKAVLRDGEIMAELNLSDAGRGIVRVVIPDDLPAESIRDDARARAAIAGRVVSAGGICFSLREKRSRRRLRDSTRSMVNRDNARSDGTARGFAWENFPVFSPLRVTYPAYASAACSLGNSPLMRCSSSSLVRPLRWRGIAFAFRYPAFAVCLEERQTGLAASLSAARASQPRQGMQLSPPADDDPARARNQPRASRWPALDGIRHIS